jgi:hypothetical protein
MNGPFAEIVRGHPDFPFDLFTTREAPDKPAFLTFDRLLRATPLVADLRGILERLQDAYQHPVEIEFALNVLSDGSYRINLLQCRPLQVRSVATSVSVEPPAADAHLLDAQGAVIGPSRVIHPDRLVYVAPSRYGAMSQDDRLAVTRVIGSVNRVSAGRTLLVLGPGRWGTRDPWLGLPVSFGEINRVAALCEIVAMNENLVPDASLGTHFLNELIEADMLYFALFPGREANRIDEAAILRLPNRLAEIVPAAARHADAVRVVDSGPSDLVLYADALRQRVVVTAASA